MACSGSCGSVPDIETLLGQDDSAVLKKRLQGTVDEVSLSKSTTIPAEWYRDDLIYQLERKAIFTQEWLYAAHVNEFPEQGCYIAFTIAGYPVIVQRTQSDTFVAFHNFCRHRGGPLQYEGRGQSKTNVFRCKYHGWVYSMDGALMHTPMLSGVEEFDKAAMSLRPLACQLYRGLIFVHFNNHTCPPLEEWLSPDLRKLLEPYPIERYSVHSDLHHTFKANWKNYVDNYSEGYHIPLVHPRLNDTVSVKQYQVINNEAGRFSEHVAPSKMGEVCPGVWVFQYPNLMLNVYGDGMNIERVEPGETPGECVLRYTYMFLTAEKTEANEAAVEFSKEVTMEDIKICEAVQKNLNAGVYTTGRLNPSMENGTWFFHQLVRRAFGAWLKRA